MIDIVKDPTVADIRRIGRDVQGCEPLVRARAYNDKNKTCSRFRSRRIKFTAQIHMQSMEELKCELEEEFPYHRITIGEHLVPERSVLTVHTVIHMELHEHEIDAMFVFADIKEAYDEVVSAATNFRKILNCTTHNNSERELAKASLPAGHADHILLLAICCRDLKKLGTPI